MIVKGMELKRPFMIIHLTIIPLTFRAFSLSCSWQLTRPDSNPALTRLHPQSQTWAKLRFDAFDDPYLGVTAEKGVFSFARAPEPFGLRVKPRNTDPFA